MNIGSTLKKIGRRKAGSWGRPRKKYLKRIAHKAMRRFNFKEDSKDE